MKIQAFQIQPCLLPAVESCFVCLFFYLLGPIFMFSPELPIVFVTRAAKKLCSDPPECFQTAIRPDIGSTVTVSTPLPLDQCSVCTISGINDTTTSCHSNLSLDPGEEVQLLFNCSQPIEEAYTVAITHKIGETVSFSRCWSKDRYRLLWIGAGGVNNLQTVFWKLECTKDECSPSTVEPPLALLKEFSRTFSWELQAPEKIVVGLNILGDGLLETSQPCPNGLQYSVATSKSSSKGLIQYCEGGSLTRFDLLNQAVISLNVKANALVTPGLFQFSAGPLSKTFFFFFLNKNWVESVAPPAVVLVVSFFQARAGCVYRWKVAATKPRQQHGMLTA